MATGLVLPFDVRKTYSGYNDAWPSSAMNAAAFSHFVYETLVTFGEACDARLRRRR